MADTTKEGLQRQKEALDAAEKELKVQERKLRGLERGSAAYRDQADLIERLVGLTEQERDLLEEINRLRKEGNIEAQENLEQSKEYLDNVNRLSRSLENNKLKIEASREYHQQLITQLQQDIKLNGDITGEKGKQLAAAKRELKGLDQKEKRLSNIEATMGRVNVANSTFFQKVVEIGEAIRMGPSAALQYLGGLLMGPLMSAVNFVFGMLKKTFVDVFFAIDNTTHALQRATGMGEKYNAGMVQVWENTNRYGVTMEKLGEQYQTLISTVSDFSLATESAGRRVAETGAMLEQVGISGQSFATGMQNSMKMFGQSMSGAEEFSRELLATSYELNIPPGQLAESYAQMGGSLAKLGRDGPQAFKELARVSKITGMEMEKILQITNKFDTFEGAAESTGQLNAALGGNFVNAMDMMMATDPVERFEMLRDAITGTGLSFDDMSYYQRQFFANAMGLDNVGDLALMMSGNMDMMSGSTQQTATDYIELAKQAQATMSLQEKFNAIFAELAPTFEGLLEQAHEWLDEILDPQNPMLDEWGEKISTIADFLVTLAENWKTVAALLIGAPALGAALSFMLNLISTAMGLIGTTAPAAAGGLGALGTGFGAMGTAALVGAKGILLVIAVMGMLYLLGPFIIEFTRIVVEGVVQIATVFFDLLAVLTGEEMIAASIMIGVMAMSIYLLTGSVVGLLSFAAGLLAVGGALMSIKTDDLTALGNFALGLGNIEFTDLPKLGQTLKEVAQAIDDIPSQKAILLTSTMEAAATAAEAVRILRGDGTTAASGRGRTRSSNSRGASGGTDLGTFRITFDDEMFESKVIRMIEDDVGRIALEAVENRS